MDILLLRLDAPLMSFGGVMVDQNGPTERFPGLSLLAGLFANALGYSHGEAERLEALQARIEYAARWDIEPEALLDYHTVDLGQEKMREAGWTTHGVPEHRKGGDAKYDTHIRYRHYWANGVMTVALALADSGEPSIDRLAEALEAPIRPLFIGRKTCLPAAPLLMGRTQAKDVLDALRRAPVAEPRFHRKGSRFDHVSDDYGSISLQACWPARLGETANSRTIGIYDRRDWRNQLHTGRRLRIEGMLEVKS